MMRSCRDFATDVMSTVVLQSVHGCCGCLVCRGFCECCRPLAGPWVARWCHGAPEVTCITVAVGAIRVAGALVPTG